jgi:formylmethanofuran dehydrogenase subunit C
MRGVYSESMLSLTLKIATSIPLDLGGIVPDRLAPLSVREIEKISLWHGNRQQLMGELFNVNGNAVDGALKFVGDFRVAVNMGAGMKSGSLTVQGNAGDNIGLGMWDGEIEIFGDAGDNLGAEMRGGVIRIRGSARTNVGGALPGSIRGMTGGTILIDGNAEDFVGYRMRRGLIAIRGSVGRFLGHTMFAGSLVVSGCGQHPGSEMSRGTICLSGGSRPELTPSFRYACTSQAPVLGMLGRQLQSLGFENDVWRANRQWQQFNGDFLTSGRGEIFVAE